MKIKKIFLLFILLNAGMAKADFLLINGPSAIFPFDDISAGGSRSFSYATQRWIRAYGFGADDFTIQYTASVTGLVTVGAQTYTAMGATRAKHYVLNFEGVGTTTVTFRAVRISDNAILGSTTVTFNITKAPLTIDAQAKSKLFGTADPALTYTVSGLRSGESTNLISGTMGRSSGENPGSYNITPSGAFSVNSPNYTIDAVNGNIFTISPLLPNAGGTLYVKQGGTGNGSSWASASSELANALLAAKSNPAIKEIWVAKGTYKPLYSPADDNFGNADGRNNAFLLVKDVKLYGGFAGTEGTPAQRNLSLAANKTILSGDFNDDDGANFANNTENAYHVLISANNVGNALLDGFTVSGGNADDPSHSILVNNSALAVFARYGGALYNYASSPRLSNCVISSNSVQQFGGGIYNVLSSSPILTNCVFSNNTGQRGGAVFNISRSAPVFNNCTFYGNIASQQGMVIYSEPLSIAPAERTIKLNNCIVWVNDSFTGNNALQENSGVFQLNNSILQYPGSGFNIQGTYINQNPLFTNAVNGDFTLKIGSPAIGSGDNALYEAADGNTTNASLTNDKDLAGNLRLQKNTIDMGAYEGPHNRAPVPDANGIVYVRQNGAGNFKGDSWADAASELADALLMAKGNTAIKQIWVAKGTYKPMYSPADNNFGNQDGRNNAFLLVKDVKVYGGFDPDNGKIDLANRNPQQALTTLSGDFNGDDVAGGTGSTLNISGNTENARHVIISSGPIGSAGLNGFTITGGMAQGVNITVNSTAIVTNGGAGMLNINSSSPAISNCIFIHNMATTGYGTAMCNIQSANPVITNCSFINNFSSNVNGQGWGDEGGAGMYNMQSAPKVVNCTFSGNLVTGNRSGGAMTNLMSNPFITNCIISSNVATAASGLYNISNSTPVVRYSLVQDMPADATNHNLEGAADPLFTNPSAGDYTLKHGSPAINSGNNALYEAADGDAGNNSLGLDKDLGGNLRLTGTNIDIGAYELQSQPQTITAGNITKTYGEAAFLPGATASSGLEVSYQSADNTIAQAFQDAADGNKWKLSIKKAGTVNITASQAGGNGYDPAPDLAFSLTINTKPVTVSIKPAVTFNKVYDAGTAGTVQVSDLELAPGAVIGSDELYLNLSSGAAQYNSPDAGSGKTITLPISSVLLSGAQAGNYSIANAPDLSTNTAVITPMPLTITASNASKVYDGLAYIGGNGVSYSTFAPGESAAQLSGTLSYSGTAQNALNTGTYSIVPAGLSSSNYAITYVNGQLTISRNNVNTLAFNAQTTGSSLIKTYGDADINASAIASSGLAVVYSSSNPAVATAAANGTVKILSAGTAIITASQPGNTNHAAATPVSFSINVQKKALTITAGNANKTYDALAYNGGAGVTYTGFIAGEDEHSLQGSLSYTGTAQAAKDVGSYFISPAGYTSGNYAITYQDGSLTITKATLTITAEAKSKVYGSSDPVLTYTSTGLKGADALTGSLLRISGENAGTYSIGQGTLTAGGNYALSYTPASLTIGKAVLTVTAENKQMCQGAGLPPFSATYSGFKYGDGPASLSTAPQLNSTGNSFAPAGNYTISASAAAAANYTFSYVNGVLTINALPVLSISSDKGASISKGETVMLSASGAGSYAWVPVSNVIAGLNSASLLVRPAETTTYTVTGKNASGCTQTQSFTITVQDDYAKLKATNILSPNNDGYNDKWVVDNIDVYPDNEVKVFDKAGRLVYTKRGYDNSWDGTFNGTALNEDTYYYIIDFGKDRPKFKGFITLIRESK